jgi:hypothetical protein
VGAIFVVLAFILKHKGREVPVERGRGCGQWKISNHI